MMMAFLTLFTAGAGYFYLQGLSIREQSAAFDRVEPVPTERNTLPAGEVARRTTRPRDSRYSEIDDFVHHYRGVEDRPAFEETLADDGPMLQQYVATAPVVNSDSRSVETSRHDFDTSARNRVGWNSDLPRVAPLRIARSNAHDFQRTAFDGDDEPVTDAGKRVPDVTDEGQRSTQVADDSDLQESFFPVTTEPTERRSQKSSTAIAEDRSPPDPIRETVQNGDSRVQSPPDGATSGRRTPDRSGKEQSVSRKPTGRRLEVTSAGRSSAPDWIVVGQSTNGLPMHTLHLGDQGTRIFLIAGLDGTDRTAIRWLEAMAEQMRAQPDLLQGTEVVFFRAGNPDGLVRNVATNARGVPLNRNFPSRRYRPAPNVTSISMPAGEIETRVMLETLYAFRPRRVIHLMSTQGQSEITYNLPGRRVALELERATKIPGARLDIEKLPGSIEDFADGTLEASVVSLKVAVGNDWARAWQAILPAVINTMMTPGADSNDDTNREFDPDSSPIPQNPVEAVSTRPNRRGYEELPPPPM